MTGRSGEPGIAAFRARLLAAMALVVVAVTLTGLYIAERSVSAETQHDLQGAFASELELLRTVREIRHTALSERCRALVRKPRIHAALEDGALDLLYPSAADELGDALPPGGDAGLVGRSIRPRFYRFQDVNGTVIPPVNAPLVGSLAPEEEQRLNFPSLPQEQQTGYFARPNGEIVEVIATPIVSTESGEAIAALVAGFPAKQNTTPRAGLVSGLYIENRLHLDAPGETLRAALEAEVAQALVTGASGKNEGRRVSVAGSEQMLFIERLNPDSAFPVAYEVGFYPLAGLLARQTDLRRRAVFAGALLLGIGIAVSFYISARLAAPVRELAAVSAENRVLRERAEAALETIRGELERSERFSANASHQLKTPVTVLRAGLDELLVRDDLPAEVRDELSLLVHQTMRLRGIIEDLLLLARLDSGRLQLSLDNVNLTHVVETCMDDLSLLHDEDTRDILCDLPPDLPVSGDARYTMLVVQNLLENARKYGKAGMPIRVTARAEGGDVILSVASCSEPIPRAAWDRIFERFHRGAMGENIAGHGLGLNLARELARLHGGDITLVRSDEEWTEFEARFPPAPTALKTAATA